ncbi:MAG: hypothetical protein AB1442_10895 [Nitrospirota bacterium]
MNSLRFDRKFVKHITLTQVEENYRPGLLNGFFVRMRRHYGDVVYLWTVEVQEKRFERTGERVLHWHIIFGFPKDSWFTGDDVKRIQSFWKYGNVGITPVRRVNTGYLMKYVTKSFGIDDPFFKGIRRIGSSQIAGWLRQKFGRVLEAMSFFTRGDFCDLSLFYWNRGRAYVKNERGRLEEIWRSREKSRWFLVDRGHSRESLQALPCYAEPF